MARNRPAIRDRSLKTTHKSCFKYTLRGTTCKEAANSNKCSNLVNLPLDGRSSSSAIRRKTWRARSTAIRATYLTHVVFIRVLVRTRFLTIMPQLWCNSQPQQQVKDVVTLPLLIRANQSTVQSMSHTNKNNNHRIPNNKTRTANNFSCHPPKLQAPPRPHINLIKPQWWIHPPKIPQLQHLLLTPLNPRRAPPKSQTLVPSSLKPPSVMN